jgi:hypothetical protein
MNDTDSVIMQPLTIPAMSGYAGSNAKPAMKSWDFQIPFRPACKAHLQHHGSLFFAEF